MISNKNPADLMTRDKSRKGWVIHDVPCMELSMILIGEPLFEKRGLSFLGSLPDGRAVFVDDNGRFALLCNSAGHVLDVHSEPQMNAAGYASDEVLEHFRKPLVY